MKIQFLGILGIGITLVLLLQSASGGRAAMGGYDRSGAPGSSGACTNYCHAASGAFTNPVTTITVKDAGGNIVTSYVPGDTYTLEFEISSDGAPTGYGLQGVVLDGNDMNTGDMLAVSTSNTQLVTIANGREFVEHQGISATGMFRTTWQAPASGGGLVTIYAIGIAVNGDGGMSGDNVTPTAQYALTEATVSNINQLEKSNYTVFPIPNNGTFQVKNNESTQALDIQVVDVRGQLVHSEVVRLDAGAVHTIHIADLASGIYSVVMNGEEKETIQMFVAK